LLLGPGPAGAAPPSGEDSERLAACIARNVPEPSSVRAVRISSRDRAGTDRVTLIRIFGRRDENGYRQLLVRFMEPEDVKGSAFLMLERPGENEMYFRSTEIPKAKRIKGAGRALALLGTDFSYEDFEHLMAFRRAEEPLRLDDELVRDRPVYVIESRPQQGSAYVRIVTYIDKETCVALRMELYEAGRGLRKRLMVNPSAVRKLGDIWVPQLALMEDELNFTSTVFMVDSSQQDDSLTAADFTPESLSQSP
jgi:hypothetical protein